MLVAVDAVVIMFSAENAGHVVVVDWVDGSVGFAVVVVVAAAAGDNLKVD